LVDTKKRVYITGNMQPFGFEPKYAWSKVPLRGGYTLWARCPNPTGPTFHAKSLVQFIKKGNKMADLWRIQVLTPDFLLEGRILTNPITEVTWTDPYILKAYEHNYIYDSSVDLVFLTETQFQPTGNLVTTDDLGTDWAINVHNSIAFIPRDEASTTYLVKQNKFKNLIAADMVIGSYLIRGKVWSPDKPDAGLKLLKKYLRVVMQDVTIDCQLPGVKLHGLEAPYAVLYTSLLQCATIRA
jgi:hypothetical protein